MAWYTCGGLDESMKEMEERITENLKKKYRIIYRLDINLQRLNDELKRMSVSEIEHEALKRAVWETLDNFDAFFTQYHEIIGDLVDEDSYKRMTENFKALQEAFPKDDNQIA